MVRTCTLEGPIFSYYKIVHTFKVVLELITVTNAAFHLFV